MAGPNTAIVRAAIRRAIKFDEKKHRRNVAPGHEGEFTNMPDAPREFVRPERQRGTPDPPPNIPEDAWRTMDRAAVREFDADLPPNPTEEDEDAWLNQAAQRRVNRAAWESQVGAALARGELTPEEAKEKGVDEDIHAVGRTDGAFTGGPWAPLPETLYHVTTARSAVRESGGLKSRDELGTEYDGSGLGGGPNNTISFTPSLEVAQNIRNDLIGAHAVLAGALTVDDLFDIADEEGFGDVFREQLHGKGKGGVTDEELDRIRRGVSRETAVMPLTEEQWAERVGPNFTMLPLPEALAARGAAAGLPPAATAVEVKSDDSRLTQQRMGIYHRFATAKEEAGIAPYSFFAMADTVAIANMDPREISILEVKPHPGAMGRVWGDQHNEEWRTFSGSAVDIADYNVAHEDIDLIVDEEMPEWRKNEAVAEYTRNGYIGVNRLLRGTIDDRLDEGGNLQDVYSDEDKAEWRKIVEEMDRVFEQESPLVHPMTLYRGSIRYEHQNLQPGDEIHDPGFVSTSASEFGALSYTDSSDPEPGTMFVIQVPAGEKAIDVNYYGGDALDHWKVREKEWLLPRGTTFRVVSVDMTTPEDVESIENADLPTVKRERLYEPYRRVTVEVVPKQSEADQLFEKYRHQPTTGMEIDQNEVPVVAAMREHDWFHASEGRMSSAASMARAIFKRLSPEWREELYRRDAHGKFTFKEDLARTEELRRKGPQIPREEIEQAVGKVSRQTQDRYRVSEPVANLQMPTMGSMVDKMESLGGVGLVPAAPQPPSPAVPSPRRPGALRPGVDPTEAIARMIDAGKTPYEVHKAMKEAGFTNPGFDHWGQRISPRERRNDLIAQAFRSVKDRARMHAFAKQLYIGVPDDEDGEWPPPVDDTFALGRMKLRRDAKRQKLGIQSFRTGEDDGDNVEIAPVLAAPLPSRREWSGEFLPRDEAKAQSVDDITDWRAGHPDEALEPDLQKDVRSVVNSILAVHTVPMDGPKVRWSFIRLGSKNLGQYYGWWHSHKMLDPGQHLGPRKFDDYGEVRINPFLSEADTKFAVTHEFGHYLDQAINLRMADHDSSNNASSTPYVRNPQIHDLFRAAGQTSLIRRMVDADVKDGQVEIPGLESFSANWRIYMLDPKEIFATAYQQWIVTRSNDESLKKTLRRLQGSEDNPWKRVWSDEEFGPIGEAMDRLLSLWGGRSKPMALEQQVDPVAYLMDRFDYTEAEARFILSVERGETVGDYYTPALVTEDKD